MTNQPLEGGRSSFRFLPMSIRLETVGGIATPLVLRGTPLPAERVDTFSTAEDNQSTVELNILAGERPLAAKSISLGKFQIPGIPPAPRGKPQVRVTLRVDRNCVVSASALVDGTPPSHQQELPIPAKYLKDAFLDKIRQDASDHKLEDDQVVSLVEATSEAERLIGDAERRLAEQRARKSGLLDAGAITSAIAAAGQAIESGDAGKIREASSLLRTSLEPNADFDFGNILGTQAFADIFARQPTYRKPSTTPTAKPRPQVRKQTGASLGQVTREPTEHGSLGRIFGGGDFSLDSNLCFVLMPFQPTFRPIYDDHIKPVVQAAGLTCQRADEVPGTGLITRDIWEKISRARFLIADLTGQNPNVFYEVGLAHAISKDVLLLAQSMTDVPFDLRAIRCLVYAYTPPGMVAFETALKTTVSALMKSG